ncbi:MAG: DNA gyrase inhibitor YacG [Steroidobacteraceae bacterium]
MSAPLVKCPTCGRSIPWSKESPLRPFCSERCKLIDLGGWLSEERRIADDESAAEGGLERPGSVGLADDSEEG